MKVGDMVVRAYAWHTIIPGIIVDKRVSLMEVPNRADFETIDFVVQWSDGAQTEEMPEELEPLEWALANERR